LTGAGVCYKAAVKDEKDQPQKMSPNIKGFTVKFEDGRGALGD